MRVIFMLIRKEFLQVFRSPLLLSILVVAPLVQFLLFPFCADYEIKVLHIAFIDHDHSTFSRDIINTFDASDYFINHGIITDREQALRLMKHDKIDFIIEFPANFEHDIYNQAPTQISVTANAINGVKAGIGTGYIQKIIGSYMQDFAARSTFSGIRERPAQIGISNIYLYNEKMNYKNLIVPGLLVILVTLIGAYVTALNLVREKEIGTIEQINVSPIRRWQFLCGKTIPFLILGLCEFLIGLVLMKVIFGISVQGNFPALLLLTIIYLLVMLGMGFFISSIAENQLQAMFIVLFLFIVFVMLSGLFTPVEGMPVWAHKLNYLNPMSFYMEVIKKIILKDGSLPDVKVEAIVLSVMAVIINAGALLAYRESSK